MEKWQKFLINEHKKAIKNDLKKYGYIKENDNIYNLIKNCSSRNIDNYWH